MTDAWYTFDGGATLGSPGSESGVILLDDEYRQAARITLEQATAVAPFAITCGIYGRLMHTRYFGSEPAAKNEFHAMRADIQEIVDGLDSDDPALTRRAELLLDYFTDKYPT